MTVRFKLVTMAFALCAAVSASAQGSVAVGSVCKDGSNDATVGRGACSRHGGVDKAATTKAHKAVAKEAKAAAKEAKAAAKETKAATKAAQAAKPSKIASATPVATVTVNCKDGSTAAAGRGACGHHGGVAPAGSVRPAPATAAPAPVAQTPRTAPHPKASASASATTAEGSNPVGASARCKDGSYSHAKQHRGACGHHGGVAQWL